jgi:hypothetical protein
MSADIFWRAQGDVVGAFGLNPQESPHQITTSRAHWRLRDYGGDDRLRSLLVWEFSISLSVALLGAISVTAPAFGEITGTAGAFTEFLTKEKDLNDDAQKLLDWSDWSQDTGLRMLDDKPARPVPGGMNGETKHRQTTVVGDNSLAH